MEITKFWINLESNEEDYCETQNFVIDYVYYE